MQLLGTVAALGYRPGKPIGPVTIGSEALGPNPECLLWKTWQTDSSQLGSVNSTQGGYPY
jgi:hypothetical protein